MFKDIKIEANKVFWTSEDKTIALELKDVFSASERKDTQLIEIETGKNFRQSKVYYGGHRVFF